MIYLEEKGGGNRDKFKTEGLRVSSCLLDPAGREGFLTKGG